MGAVGIAGNRMVFTKGRVLLRTGAVLVDSSLLSEPPDIIRAARKYKIAFGDIGSSKNSDGDELSIAIGKVIV